ncbi:ATP-binding protein [Polaribacter sp. R77954]|uniref:ATP-binding protein n=1 Tax=Polaribacter sp. R77954 TaxID=3093870 RepID=UPI0037CC2D65
MNPFNRIVFIILLVFSFQSISGKPNQENKKHSLNFSNDQLFQKKGIPLNSNWEFYWKTFINPKDFTNQQPLHLVKLTSWTNYTDNYNKKLPAFGYATYRKKFTIPKERPNTALYIPRIIGAYKIWINGVFILETGTIGITQKTTLHRRFTKIIPLNSNDTDFEVVIQVSNFYNKFGGITEPILLGVTEHLFYKKSLQIMADMTAVGSFSFVGLLFLIFYLLYWNKDKAVLFFSLMCLALSYHTLNDRYAPLSEVFKDISWVFLAKTEYIASYIVGYCASMFFIIVLKEYVHFWFKKVMQYATGIIIFAAIVLPAPHFTYLIPIFLVFMMLTIAYIVFCTIKAIIHKSKASRLLLIGIVFGATVFSANIVFYIQQHEIALIYVKFGYIMVFLLISMLLLRRFSSSFKDLEEANMLALAQKKEIYVKSKQLTNVNLQLEENLKLLENNNEELEDFNHIVSHDLKTPLVSVYSLASFIEEDLKDSLDENTTQHINMMKEVITKMEASINGLLEYSKAAKGNKRKEWFNVNTTLQKVFDLIQHQKKSTLKLPKNQLKIYANKLEFEHVFQNLMSNSIKYNDKEEAILTVDFKMQNNEYLFSIADNGPGIEKQYHNKIFKIFSQLESNPKEVSSTGIGLAIVKKVVANNNGIISVSSEKGKGLTISFTWQKGVEGL